MPRELEEVAFRIDEHGLVSALKYVPYPFVPPIGCLGVDAVQVLHAGGEVGLDSPHDQMIVIGHLAVGVTSPVESFHDVGEYVQEGLAIRPVLVDRLLAVAAGHHMIQCAGKFYS